MFACNRNSFSVKLLKSNSFLPHDALAKNDTTLELGMVSFFRSPPVIAAHHLLGFFFFFFCFLAVLPPVEQCQLESPAPPLSSEK